ncbi:MAG: site-2 protease family protein, partial [Myxococcota bacterium]
PVLGPLTYTHGETEYCICAFPIGGYVKMFGMQPEELYDVYGQKLPEAEIERAFVRKPIWQRFIIVLAGPVMNLILPIFIYYFFALGTTQLPPAEVGQVFPDNPAATAAPLTEGAPVGLQPGDRIIAVDGEPIHYFRDLTSVVREAIDTDLKVTIKRGDKTLDYRLRPEPYTKTDRLGLTRETYGLIGVSIESYGPILGIRDPKGPAAQAGLQHFDRVVAVNQKPISRYVELVDAVRLSNGKPLSLTVVRPQGSDFLEGGLNVATPLEPIQVTPVLDNGSWTLGTDPAEMYLAHVESEGPADRAGLKVGDKILAVSACDDASLKSCGKAKNYNNMRSFTIDIRQRIWEAMHNNDDLEPADIKLFFKIDTMRGQTASSVAYSPVVRMVQGSFNEPIPEVWLGLDTYEDYTVPDFVDVPLSHRAWIGLEEGFGRTWQFSKMMVLGIAYLFQGRVSTDTVGGPIMIFDIAQKAGKAGIEPFLRMMALISINLGLVNLLPIPLLDGGHLMLFTIEAVQRRELSARTRQITSYIGLGLIVMLMLLAFKNDIERYWQTFADWFNG